MSWQERLAVLRDLNRWEPALLNALSLLETAKVQHSMFSISFTTLQDGSVVQSLNPFSKYSMCMPFSWSLPIMGHEDRGRTSLAEDR